MASITQTIPNFFGGISEVPDSQKGQGQVRDLMNCIPDLNRGLYKRPGARRIGTDPLSNATSDGLWFHYYRDETEGSYIGQVATNGHVTMWDAETGAEITVNHDSGTESYLSHSGGEQLQFTTINDSTFVCNRNTTTAMTGSTTDSRPHTYSAFIELKRVQNGRQYGLNIHDPTSSTLTTINTATRISVQPTAAHTEGFTTYTGDNGHCPAIGTAVFGESNPSGNQYNLVFRLTTTGQQGPVPTSNDETPESGDFTCSYQTTIDLLHGGEGWEHAKDGNPAATRNVTMAGKEYVVTIDDSEEVQVRASIKAVRPAPTPFDGQTNVSVDTILGGITAELSGTGIDYEVIGNGIYLYSNSTNFTVEAQNTDLMTVITDEVNDVTGLPFQSKHGYIVKVANSTNADDDYYLKFAGNGGASGPGSWIECAEPGISKEIDDSTMPLIIQRQANGNFQVKKFTYADREVGDNTTNPVPSFIGKSINKVVFFRNRLAFLSDENIILSRPGDLGNFFVNTALTVSGTDPIDLSSSSRYPGILFDAIEINTGLLVFGEKQQFLLATDSDILNPDSARLSSISTYNYNTAVPPFSLGTVAGFLDNAGSHSRFFVMSNVAREGEPNVNELSKVVSRMLSKELNLIANSRENTAIFFGKTNDNEVFGYKYFNVADKQVQSSWFRWRFPRNLRYHCVVNDSYLLVDDQNFLQRLDLIRDDEPTIQEHRPIGAFLENEYLVHLDNHSSATGTYDSATRKTTFTLGWLNYIDRSKALTAIQPGTSGLIHQFFIPPSTGTTVTLDGDWSASATSFGYDFSMRIIFPKFFIQKVSGDRTLNEERGSLVIHRIKPSFGRLGQYDASVSRTGKDIFNLSFRSSTYDRYLADDVLVEDEFQGVIPVYEKNDNFLLTIYSASPLPATLISLTWEGDYSPKYYKNV